MPEALQALHEARLIGDLDRVFGEWVGVRDGEVVGLAAALTSAEVAKGHVYLDLEAAAQTLTTGGLDVPPDWPQALTRGVAVAAPGERAPLVLDGTHLYLHRYWCYENRIAASLLERAESAVETDATRLGDALREPFPDGGAGELDRQALAAAIGASRRLTILSGGPGTGKTTTVIKLLRLARRLDPSVEVALAAPSGKAAARLAEALANGWPAAAEPLEAEPKTLHRLLGYNSRTQQVRHAAGNPLPADLVVVDEASMVDIGLMARLVAALKPGARLVLVGDRDQLASVEAGAVFGDLCSVAAGFPPAHGERLEGLLGAPVPRAVGEASPVSASIALLKRNYRFRGRAIGALAQAVIHGNTEEALAAFSPSPRRGERRGEGADHHDDLAWRPVATEGQLTRELERICKTHFAPIQNATDVEEALVELARFRLLAAERRGAFGVEGLNARIESLLGVRPSDRWYRGRPVLITENDYELKLFNGDSGIVWPGADGHDKLWLRATDGRLKSLAVARLPAHETAWALTVHKAQGSEFERIALVLPPRESAVATRELVYTGLTRAREAVEVWATEPALKAAITRRIRRASGLAERLKNVGKGC